jgi:hypothetical protein
MRRDDSAISSVLGAVLVFGLLIMTLVTVQVKFVPVWDRDREADQMQILSNQLGQLKSDLDRMADNRTSVPIADPLTLEPRGAFRFFQGARVPSEVSLAPAAPGDGVRLSTTQARVLSIDGQAIFAGGETWTGVASGQTVTNVGAIQNLRLRIANPASWSTGDSVNVALTNATGAYAGKIVISNIDHGSQYTLRVETFARSSSTVPISITELLFEKKNPPSYQYLDLLQDNFVFRQVLAASQAPSTLTLNRNNLNVDYTMGYIAINPSGGGTQVGGAGTIVPNFSRSFLSGSLAVDAHNQRYVPQTYVLEHGAVILSQPDGDVMHVAPSFSASVVAGIVDVRWVLPAMNGVSTTLSGPSSATIALQPTTPTSFIATMPRLDVRVATEHGAVWAQHWTSVLQAAGLAYGTQFTVSSNTTAAQLTLFGLLDSPTSTVDDITVTFRGAVITTAASAGA